MEKTILYSKKASQLSFNIKSYQKCQHEHCKQLITQIKFLSNALTQKVFKEQVNAIQNKNILKQKQNNFTQKFVNNQLNKTLVEEVQNLKKNFTKLRKQLSQIQTQNDQLFEENLSLKNKIEKIQSNNSNKSIFQLSLTKGNQISGHNSKSSFFVQTKCQSQFDHKTVEDCQDFIHKELDFKFDNLATNRKQTSTDRSQIYNKFEKLTIDYKIIQIEYSNNEEKLQQYENLNKKLEYENSQLKKIIKLRNQIQSSRHKVINDLRNVLDQIGV